MDFKDKLKGMRNERNITQAELAKAIFVSRSAVAKWESGRGLPNEDSQKALASYFGVDEKYFSMDAIDDEEIKKVQRREKIDNIISAILGGILIIFFIWLLLYALGFRFDSRECAGNNDYLVHTKEYDFYFDTPSNDNGEYYCMLVTPVKRFGFLYHEMDSADHLIRMEAEDGTKIGYIKVYNGRNCTYNIYVSETKLEPGVTHHLYLDDTMIINGKEIELYRQSYFVMKDKIETIEFMGMKIKLTKVK